MGSANSTIEFFFALWALLILSLVLRTRERPSKTYHQRRPPWNRLLWAGYLQMILIPAGFALTMMVMEMSRTGDELGIIELAIRIGALLLMPGLISVGLHRVIVFKTFREACYVGMAHGLYVVGLFLGIELLDALGAL